MLSEEPDLTRELDEAEAIVMGTEPPEVRALRAMRWLIEARYEVIAGSRKADGAQGFFAALEHLDLYEPEEFYGDTLPEAIRRAHAWAVAKERENVSSSSAATGEDGSRA